MAATAAKEKADLTTRIAVTDLRQNKAAIVSTYSRIPEKAEAIQFQGWDNAPQCIHWLGDTYFVPAGYPHALRREDEYNAGSGEANNIRSSASEFLVYHIDGNDYRIDLGHYIIRTQSGQLYFYDAATFKGMFQEAVLP
jgi:hypothetical protein